MPTTFYIQVIDGAVVGHPVTAENLKYLVSGEVTDVSAAGLNYVPISENKPELLPNQICTYAGWSQKDDGALSIDWDVITFTQDEMIDRLIRGRRAMLLAASDWTQSSDSPLTAEKKAEWAAYRQELRDMTTTFKDAIREEDVTWPEQPAK